ncbi:hypothetical protein Srot_0952 [Segniliparus rotundus DSM 44985]|uniref:Uncharacterized protein n=1 Tax=Segniliparus rotundus (strain ATCC BAA-972 / CDC 1076 / CIP 108378 / DSM 44985 / JCM 13578) TaxID=640132 RepID=D6ZEQ1_SEGRD|nr:hypothetical protein [Segniliparus rotundus]ADG97425.1 hypothetical protein Srot_0952 [Segniliparus rotundus DSM 44985]
MSEVMTAPRPDRVAPRKLIAGRACANTVLSGGVRRVSPSGAPAAELRCARAPIKTVQPELPQVSGSSAILTALMLVAIAFGVLFIASWRQSSITGPLEQEDVPAHAAAWTAPGDGPEGPGAA